MYAIMKFFLNDIQLRKDHETKGGSILIAINSHFPFNQIPAPENIKLTIVSIHLQQILTICAFLLYIFLQTLITTHKYYQSLCSYSSTIISSQIILGDFNAQDIAKLV